jgi:hypothetical protein
VTESHFTPDYYPSRPFPHDTEDWSDTTWNAADGPYELTHIWETVDQTYFGKTYSTEPYHEQEVFGPNYTTSYPPPTLEPLLDGDGGGYATTWEHVSIGGGVDGDPWHYRFSPTAIFRQQQHGLYEFNQDTFVNSVSCTFNVLDSNYRVGYGPVYAYPYEMFADGVTPYKLQAHETVSHQFLDFAGSATYPLKSTYPQDWGPYGHLTNGDLHIQIFGLLGIHEYTPWDGHDPDYVQPDASFTHDFHVYKIPYTGLDSAVLTSPKNRADFSGELLLTIRFHCTINSNGRPASEWGLGYWPPDSHEQMTYEISYPGPQPDAVLMNPEGGEDIVLRGVWTEAELDNQEIPAYNTTRHKWAIVVCSDWEVSDPVQDLGTDIAWTPNDSQYYYLYNHTVSPEIAVYASYEVTMPDFRYWITYTPEVPCSPLAPQPFNKQLIDIDQRWPIGGAGHYLTVGSSPTQSFVSLFHAGDPGTRIAQYPMGEGNLLRPELVRRELNDDGVVCFVMEVAGSYGERLAYLVKFEVVNDALVWERPAFFRFNDPVVGMANFVQVHEIGWSAHTNDGLEFIVYMTGRHKGYVIAMDWEGNEIWRSPTPKAVGPGAVGGPEDAFWQDLRNTGSVIALPCAGRFVWNNTSPSEVYISTQYVYYSSIDYTSTVAPTDYTYHFNVPNFFPDATGQGATEIYVTGDGQISGTPRSAVVSTLYFDGVYGMTSYAPSYDPNRTDRPVYHSYPYPSGFNTYASTNRTIRTVGNAYGNMYLGSMGFRWTLRVPNSAADGHRAEIRGPDNLILATTEGFDLTGYDRCTGTGIIRVDYSGIDTGEVDPWGDPIYEPGVEIFGWNFVGDEFTAWPGNIVRVPGIPGGGIAWDVFKGRIAVANRLTKPPLNPT